MMKLPIALSIVLTFSPLIVIGSIDFETIANATCKNEVLTLRIDNSVSFSENSMVSLSLKCVVIKGRNVQFEDGAFKNTPNLKFLDLSNNEISANQLFQFGNLLHVKLLDLSYQNSNYYYDTIIKGVYPELEYLNVRHAYISRISVSWSDQFPKLTYLDLSGNRITSLSPGIPTLTHLDLSDNSISQFSFEYLENLLSLTLDNNKIQSLEKYVGVDLSMLQKLEKLSIAYNKLMFINSNAITKMSNLRYLNLSGNSLLALNFDMFESLKSLGVLVLDDNAFDAVPTTAPLNITELSLKRNNITYLSIHSFHHLYNLRKLFLSENKIRNISMNTFQNQALLEELYLNDNELSYLPTDWCASMEKLRYLNLAGNKFTSLESVIYSSTLPVEQLHFERNSLIYIDATIVQMIPENMKIYLNAGSTSHNQSYVRDTSITMLYR